MNFVVPPVSPVVIPLVGADACFPVRRVYCVGQPMELAEMAREIAKRLNRQPLVVGDGNRRIERIAWCSGGAQGYFEEAVTLGADAYLCGEISEHNVHLARESGVAFIAAGHHATERFGVQAVARHISERLGLECEFVDIDSPV